MGRGKKLTAERSDILVVNEEVRSIPEIAYLVWLQVVSRSLLFAKQALGQTLVSLLSICSLVWHVVAKSLRDVYDKDVTVRLVL